MAMDTNIMPPAGADSKTGGTGDIDAAVGELKGREAIAQKRLDQFREVVIKAMFKLMKDAGVDANDLQSIQGFLAELEAQDPDLAELFDVAFNDLTGQGDQQGAPETGTEGQEGSGLMDKYSNLSGAVMGPGGTPPPDMGAPAGMQPDMSSIGMSSPALGSTPPGPDGGGSPFVGGQPPEQPMQPGM